MVVPMPTQMAAAAAGLGLLKLAETVEMELTMTNWLQQKEPVV